MMQGVGLLCVIEAFLGNYHFPMPSIPSKRTEFVCCLVCIVHQGLSCHVDITINMDETALAELITYAEDESM